MRRLILVIALTFSSMFLYAQTFNVKGVVTDVTGETLPGVNVIVKNSSKGDVTDFDGNYKISAVPKGSILVFSYLGFTHQRSSSRQRNHQRNFRRKFRKTG